MNCQWNQDEVHVMPRGMAQNFEKKPQFMRGKQQFQRSQTQYSLFILLDLSILKVIHSGKIMLNSKRNTYILTQTDPSYRKLETVAQA